MSASDNHATHADTSGSSATSSSVKSYKVSGYDHYEGRNEISGVVLQSVKGEIKAQQEAASSAVNNAKKDIVSGMYSSACHHVRGGECRY